MKDRIFNKEQSEKHKNNSSYSTNPSENSKNTMTEPAVAAMDTSKTTLNTVGEEKFDKSVKDIESDNDIVLPSKTLSMVEEF